MPSAAWTPRLANHLGVDGGLRRRGWSYFGFSPLAVNIVGQRSNLLLLIVKSSPKAFGRADVNRQLLFHVLGLDIIQSIISGLTSHENSPLLVV